MASQKAQERPEELDRAVNSLLGACRRISLRSDTLLGRDRRVEATTPETRRTAKLDWFVVGALVAVALAVIAFVVAS